LSKVILGTLEVNRIYQLDCLKGMSLLPDKSIDMILCDLPYGTTECTWDSIIPLDKLFEQYRRIIKDTGAIVLTAIQPFTTSLIANNLDIFKYTWVWEKNRPSGFAQAKNKPLKSHEDILVFSKGVTVHASQSNKRMVYNPQGLIRVNRKMKNSKSEKPSVFGKRANRKAEYEQEFTNYPKSVLKFDCESKPVHPTQKPVALFEYLIRTYTNEGEIVLDNCMGSGTTAVAALKSNRKFIGFEIESKYIEIANKRIESIYNELDDQKLLLELNEDE
jgi:site-specific DNA-methyltransferase (adenine-specific)